MLAVVATRLPVDFVSATFNKARMGRIFGVILLSGENIERGSVACLM